jgi:hypothetical protein
MLVAVLEVSKDLVDHFLLGEGLDLLHDLLLLGMVVWHQVQVGLKPLKVSLFLQLEQDFASRTLSLLGGHLEKFLLEVLTLDVDIIRLQELLESLNVRTAARKN